MALIPAVVVGTLGFVYALGAIAVYGQVRGEGFSGTQVMPLVPVEQILGHGIGSISSLFSKVAGLVVVAFFTSVGYWSDASEIRLAHPKEWSKFFRYGMPFLFLFLALTQPWEEAVVVAIGIASLLALWAVAWLLKIRGWKAVVILSSGALIAVIPMSVASSLLKPTPLPVVVLERPHLGDLRGTLIAETGSNWYLGMPDGSVRAIPNGRAIGASITYPKRTRPPSLLKRVFG